MDQELYRELQAQLLDARLAARGMKRARERQNIPSNERLVELVLLAAGCLPEWLQSGKPVEDVIADFGGAIRSIVDITTEATQ